MSNQIKASIKIGISCMMFDTPKFQRILLIKREQPPMENKWSFPGGRLEPGETIANGIEREAYEETGYKIKLAANSLFNIEEFGQGKYTIITGMAFLNDLKSLEEGRTEKDKNIYQKMFSLEEGHSESIWNLSDDDCIPNLKNITRRVLDTYKGKF